MTTQRRVYTLEFKIEAVKMVTEKGLTTRQVADEIGVHVTTIRTWISKFEGQNIEDPKKASQEIQEIRKLQETVRQLKIERDILKKAAAIFVK